MRYKNLFWGLFFILAGVLIVLRQVGVFTGINLGSMIITILLIPVIIKSINRLNFFGIIFPISIIGLLFKEQLGIPHISIWVVFLVATLISIGLSYIFPCKDSKQYRYQCANKENNIGEDIDTVNENEINITENFVGSVKYINSENLEKINIVCSFSSLKIYLDNAKLKEDKAEINLDVNFSGVEIYVPKNWRISTTVASSFMGAIEEEGRPLPNAERTIILRGKASFSGVTLKYI